LILLGLDYVFMTQLLIGWDCCPYKVLFEGFRYSADQVV